MSPLRKRIESRQPLTKDDLPDGLPPLIRNIYLHRGVGTPDQLDLGLKQLLSYHGLKGIADAARLLVEAIQLDWHILIVGDFDADGATSTALAMTALTRLGAKKLGYLVPDRFKFGYGLTPGIVELARQQSPDLIITVDNGISSIDGVAQAKEAGIRVLVTDHHLPVQIIPEADVIVNPNQPGCEFPSKNLSGVGVIFYVMLALRAEMREEGLIDDSVTMSDLLDLVALGTVADLVPLDYNNRILVHQGLHRIRHGRARPGISALCHVAGREPSRLSAMDLGYFLGPRINAAGRLEDMSFGIECLMERDEQQALIYAQRLHDLNAQRRELQDQMQSDAEALMIENLDAGEMPKSFCLFDENWHEGIVGLVASRVKEKYHRPAIAFAPSGQDGVLKGSARSIPGLHIRDTLDLLAASSPEVLSKFGGHAMAAGLSIKSNDLEKFRNLFEEAVSASIEQASLDPVIESDGELTDADFTLGMAETLEQAGPWGQRFPNPVFHGEFRVLEKRVVGEKHLKLKLCPQDGERVLDAIAFNASDQGEELLDSVRLAYRLDVNEYMGNRNVQLIVEYLDV